MIVKFAQHHRGRGTAGRGDSFTGTAKYLLDHDRPEWTATENLGTDNPYMAARVMQAVSMHADELKERAGVSRAGRKKLDGDVFHMVVSWPEGTHPDQDHQAQAVRDALKSIGLEKAQAILAAHNDNGKSHVHAMVNLVNPEDGRLFKMPFSKDRASAWALEYSRQHGDDSTPQREENAAKRQANRDAHDKARAAGEPAPALHVTKDRASLTRGEYERMKAARDEFFSRQAAERAALKSAQSQEWTAAKAEIAASAYNRAFRDEHAKAKAADKLANKPLWREVFSRQDRERQVAAITAQRVQAEARAATDMFRKADKATRAAEKRDGTLFGKVAALLGAQSVEQARQARARAMMAAQEVKNRLQAAQAARDALPRLQEQARKDTAAKLAQITFQKAELAVTVPRVDLAAMKARHAEEFTAQWAKHNVEREAAGIVARDPTKAREQDNQARARDRQNADRPRDREQAPSPFGRAAGTAKDQERYAEAERIKRDKRQATEERDRARSAARADRAGPEPKVMGKPPRPRFGPSLSQEQMERRRERQQREKDRERGKGRDDFDRER